MENLHLEYRLSYHGDKSLSNRPYHSGNFVGEQEAVLFSWRLGIVAAEENFGCFEEN